jgi:hypothetical protein
MRECACGPGRDDAGSPKTRGGVGCEGGGVAGKELALNFLESGREKIRGRLGFL